jgi:hypothetical protein
MMMARQRDAEAEIYMPAKLQKMPVATEVPVLQRDQREAPANVAALRRAA